MPYFVIGGLPAQRPTELRERYALLRRLTLVGGPFAQLEDAREHVERYLPAAHRHAQTMLGVPLPWESYTVVEGVDLVAALFAAVGLPDPGER
jgi:hypothetical protein